MTLEEQRQIMLSGAMYNDLTPELIRARENAVRLADAYNRSFGGPAGEREAILRRLLKSIGKGVHFEPDFHTPALPSCRRNALVTIDGDGRQPRGQLRRRAAAISFGFPATL